jgi:hypothetical protein
VAAGRNLMVRRALWRAHGGLAADAADPFLEWAWATAATSEPVFLDEPAYLIPAGTEGVHLHAAGNAMIAATARDLRAGSDAAAGAGNDFRQQGIARFWALQWRLLSALQGAEGPDELLLGCAVILGIDPGAPGTEAVA